MANNPTAASKTYKKNVSPSKLSSNSWKVTVSLKTPAPN